MKTTVEQTILKDILKERQRQDEKWGKDRKLDPYTWLTILGEEYGEVCKAALENDKEGYREELIQVAAVAVAAIEGFDKA